MSRSTVAAGICAMPALLVIELTGRAWQPDAHMEFFALLAFTATMLDARAVLVGALVVAVHHLALNLVLPALVFPGGGDLFRVLFHAVILVVEAAALTWMVDRASAAISTADRGIAEMSRLAEQHAVESSRAQAAAAEQRRRTTLELALELDQTLGGIAASLAASSADLHLSADAVSASTAQASQQAAVATESSQVAGTNVQTVAAAHGRNVGHHQRDYPAGLGSGRVRAPGRCMKHREPTPRSVNLPMAPAGSGMSCS